MRESDEHIQFYVGLILIVLGLLLAIVMVSMGAIVGP